MLLKGQLSCATDLVKIPSFFLIGHPSSLKNPAVAPEEDMYRPMIINDREACHYVHYIVLAEPIQELVRIL